MRAKSNASTTGNMAQDSKLTTDLEWKCSHCSYTNEEDMSRALFVDTDEAGQTCIMCCNLRLPVFHQVMKIHLQRNNYYREAEYSNKSIIYCVFLVPFVAM
jgi:hypothetical protein